MQENKILNIDKNSIRFAFWKYFSVFAVIILVALWLFQIVFLNRFYETMKIHEVTKIGDYLIGQYNKKDFENMVLNYSQKKGMSIEVIDQNGHLIYPLTWIDVIMNPKIISDDTFDKYFQGVGEKEKKYRVSIVSLEHLDTQTIVYGAYLGSGDFKDYYLLIKTPLQPVDSAIDILTKILVIVSILSLFLALIVSYFFSKRLSKPLIEMSKTAKRLGNGNFKVNFKKGYYTEIDDLSNTLNYATSELTKTIEVRKDLIANVSHDLKTPLTVIKSYGEMIKDISGNNEIMRNRHIDTIISEADNLTSLVNDLLDISKIESKLEDIQLEKVNLTKLAQVVVDRFKILFEKKNYIFSLDSYGDTNILADKRRLEQVIYNFINNAINYSVTSREIKIVIKEEHGKVRFDCIDKGIGISEDKIDNIWDRFYRARDNHSRPSVGTGLGLYIVKSILDIHKFSYGVESKINEGSDFYFIADSFKKN